MITKCDVCGKNVSVDYDMCKNNTYVCPNCKTPIKLTSKKTCAYIDLVIKIFETVIALIILYYDVADGIYCYGGEIFDLYYILNYGFPEIVVLFIFGKLFRKSSEKMKTVEIINIAAIITAAYTRHFLAHTFLGFAIFLIIAFMVGYAISKKKLYLLTKFSFIILLLSLYKVYKIPILYFNPNLVVSEFYTNTTMIIRSLTVFICSLILLFIHRLGAQLIYKIYEKKYALKEDTEN